MTLTLALAVVLAAAPSVFAAQGDLGGVAFHDIAGHPAEAALSALGALGVFSGSQGIGGPVDPDNPINREQYCKVVVVASGLEGTANLMYNLQPATFGDHAQISRWAWGYVNAAVHAGIIQGYEDGTFKPQRPVTYAEAIVMLIRSVKNHAAQIDNTMPWPLRVLFYGIPAGFAGDVMISDPNGSCTRGDMARMLLATMHVSPLLADGSPDPAGPILKEGARLRSGQFVGRDGINIYLDTYPGPLALGEPVFIVGATTYEGCVGNQVVCIAKPDGKIVYIRLLAGSSSTGVFKTKGSDAGGTFLELKDGRKYYYIGDVPVVLNNDTATPNTQNNLISNDELFFNLDGDGKVVAITAKRFDLVRWKATLPLPLLPLYFMAYDDYLSAVTASTPTTPTKIKFNGVSTYYYRDVATACWLPLQDAELDVGSGAVVKVNGVPANRNTLAADDVLRVATFGAKGYNGAASIIEISASRMPVEGTVVTNITQVTAEGTKYFVRLNVGGTNYDYERRLTYLPMEPMVGELAKFSRDFEGRLFHMITYGVVWYDGLVTGSAVAGATYEITVDHRGVTTTYSCIADASGLVGQFCRYWVKEGINQVIFAMPAALGSFQNFTVLAASAANVTIQGASGTFFDTDDAVVVYRKTGPTSYTYIGCAGLSAGNAVKAFVSGADVIFIIYEP